MSASFVTSAATRIARFLVGNPPMTVSDLVKASGITRTAVSEQLNELVAAGYVKRTIARSSGRGRPRNLYSITSAALVDLFKGNEHIVIPAIWKVLEGIGGNELLQQTLERLAEALANHYRSRITAKTPEERLRQLADLLQEDGEVAEVDSKKKSLLQKKSCGFFCMIDPPHRNVCRLDEKMLGMVVGQPIQRTACRHEGAPCCCFEIKVSISPTHKTSSTPKTLPMPKILSMSKTSPVPKTEETDQK